MTGSIAIETVSSVRSEVFYWITISFSQTLGTALGDWAADDGGLGYLVGALVSGARLAVSGSEVPCRAKPIGAPSRRDLGRKALFHGHVASATRHFRAQAPQYSDRCIRWVL